MIRAFLFCLATVGVFINIEGRDAALARPIELAVGRISVPGLVEPVGGRRGHRRHDAALQKVVERTFAFVVSQDSVRPETDMWGTA